MQVRDVWRLRFWDDAQNKRQAGVFEIGDDSIKYVGMVIVPTPRLTAQSSTTTDLPSIWRREGDDGPGWIASGSRGNG